MILNELHNSQETAIVVHNYPYGFTKRTDIRFWIETNGKGDRFMSQTLNPDTFLWNNPKASTYYAVCVLTKNDVNGHIECLGLSEDTMNSEAIDSFVKVTEGYQFDPRQAIQLRLLTAKGMAYGNTMSILINLQDKTPEQIQAIRKEQEIVKLELDNLVYKHFRALG